MMTQSEISASLQVAVTEYFAGERFEGWLIVSASLVFTVLATWLWAATRTSFALAFAATVLVSGLLLAGVAGSLLVRDKGLERQVLQSIDSPTQASVVRSERERVGIIVSKYKYYRYGAAILAALSVLGLMLSSRGWVHGIAAALLLLVVAQVIIDHYSEHRARSYFGRLSHSAVARAG